MFGEYATLASPGRLPTETHTQPPVTGESYSMSMGTLTSSNIRILIRPGVTLPALFAVTVLIRGLHMPSNPPMDHCGHGHAPLDCPAHWVLLTQLSPYR